MMVYLKYLHSKRKLRVCLVVLKCILVQFTSGYSQQLEQNTKICSWKHLPMLGSRQDLGCIEFA